MEFPKKFRQRFRQALSLEDEEANATWQDKRVAILRHMLENNGYQYYLDIMERLVKMINTVLNEDHITTEAQRAHRMDVNPGAILDSSEFDKSNDRIRGTFCDLSSKRPWWQQDFPDLKIDSFDAVGLAAQAVTNKSVVDFAFSSSSWMAPYQLLLITTCISAYFRQTDAMVPVHRNMRYALETSDSTKEWLKIPQAYIAGAGPFLIKTLQQVSNGLRPGDKLKTITESVFSSIMPMTAAELQVVRDNLKVKEEYRNFSDESLGSASIGETHVCLGADGETPIGVLKFIKPVSAWMFLCEVDFLLSTVWKDLYIPGTKQGTNEAMNIKKCRQLLLFLIREFALEFDVGREAQGTKDAREIYYRPKIGILTPALLDFNPVPVPVLVLEYIKGQSLETFMDDLGKKMRDPTVSNKYILHCLVPIQRRIAMLMGLWLQELFWGSGRFDADPHKGNVIVPSCEDLQTGAKPFLALIDFGSHGKLDRRAQCVVFKTLISGERITQLKTCMPNPRTKEDPSMLESLIGNPKLQQIRTERLIGLRPELKYFKEFPTMSEHDQIMLFSNVNKEIAKDPHLHERNLGHVRDVVRNIWKICNIREDPRETDTMVNDCINYGYEVDFGSIFMYVAQEAKTIGTCSSSNVLMYGRGLAYLDQMWRMSREMCTAVEDVRAMTRNENDLMRYLGVGMEKCDRRKLIGLIWKFFVSKPRLTFDYATACFFAKSDKKPAAKKEQSSARAQSRT
jgi:hypothetical protein